MSLVDKVVELHRTLDNADVPHAFGGALALAYHARPRGTTEIDVDIFLPPARSSEVFDVLRPLDIVAESRTDEAPPVAGRRGLWDDTHVDLFFAFDDEFFDHVARRVERHLFLDSEGTEYALPFLSAEDLTVFKITFDRTKDWADIEAIIEHGPLDVAYVERWLLHLRGDRIWPRLRRFLALAGVEPPRPQGDEPRK